MLAEDVANGKTYTLYPGLFTPIIWVMLASIGLLYFVSENVVLKHAVILIVFLWPMIIMLNFFIYGYVVGDQPRLEFAIASLTVDDKMSLREAADLSGYFRWPSTWLLEGIFSGVLGITPFEAPVYLMVATYFLLGMALINLSRGVSKYLSISSVYVPAFLVLLTYTMFNPYKIWHFCPQIYALTLFIFFLGVLIGGNMEVKDFTILSILATAIITSHPLTSIVVAGIAAILIISNLIKKDIELRKGLFFSISVMVLFTSWNLNYEELIKNVINELTMRGVQIQPLPPISSMRIYEIDTFFKLMIMYRYFSLAILVLLLIPLAVSLLTSSKLRRILIRSRIIAIGIGVLLGVFLLNFVPGSFFHRLLYFVITIMCAFIPSSISVLRDRVGTRSLSIFLSFLLLSSPLLSHVAVLEFLTNNNPVATITGPYEALSSIFIARHYDEASGCIGVPSGAFAFYAYMFNHKMAKTLCLTLISGRAIYITMEVSNPSLARKFVKIMYGGTELFMVSPRERFAYYLRTNFDDFALVDQYLSDNYLKIYDNNVYQVYYNIEIT
jgi:hypothetical protein